MIWFIIGLLVGHYVIPDLKVLIKRVRGKDNA